MTVKVVGLGAGGHAKVLLDLLSLIPGVNVVAMLDPNPARRGTELFGVPILGGDDQLPQAMALGARAFFIGVGRVGPSALPRRLFELAQGAGLDPLDALHPTAVLARSHRHGAGLCALAGAVVNADARLGEGVVLNTGAIVEHDVHVGDHVFLGPRATVLGGVQIGSNAFLGAGCVIRQGLSIGEGAVIGAGAVVLQDVPPGACVVGVPARPRGPA